MEIIRENPPHEPSGRGYFQARNVYVGAAVFVLGALWLMVNFDLLGTRFCHIVFSWQMLAVLIGGYLLVSKRPVTGGIVLVAGILFGLTDLFGLCIPVSGVVLPIVVMALGLALVFTPRCRR